MRILLLHPYNPLEGYHYPVPQVALGYLSAGLKQAGFDDVHVKDAHLYRYTVEETVEYACRLRPDVLGLRVWSHQVKVVEEIARRLRARLPRLRIVLGGPHLAVIPDYLADVEFSEFGFWGEAEEGLPLLVRHLDGDPTVAVADIPGLVWKDAAGALHRNRQSNEMELDRFAVEWDALELPEYHRRAGRTTAYNHGTGNNAFIFMTRGCPYPCTYCAAYITNGKKIRAHSGERMVEDIAHLYHRYGVRHFNLMDDNFTFYKDIVLDFCEAFLRRRDELPGVTFHNPNGVRVDRLDDEMLAIMRRCGWQWLHIGVEAASRATLKRMKKRLDIDLARENIAMIRRHGLRCWGFFIIGFKDETAEDIETTIDWAVRSELNAATFSIFSPIPGTEVYRELHAEGRLPPDFLSTSYMSPEGMVFADGLSAADLRRLQRRALLRFYARPDRAWHLLRDMSPGTVLNRAWHFAWRSRRGVPPDPLSSSTQAA